MDGFFPPDFVNLYAPVLTYLALALGLWLAITAAYLPGTGVPELASFLALGLAAVGLILLHSNPFGVALMVAGTACFLALLTFRRVWPLILAGVILQTAGSMLLFPGDSRLHWGIILLVALIALAYYQIILMPGLRIQDRARQTGPDTLIGAQAEVIRTLDPVGSVRLHGEIWTARSEAIVESGRQVRVIARDGLELQVLPADSQSEAPPVPRPS